MTERKAFQSGVIYLMCISAVFTTIVFKTLHIWYRNLIFTTLIPFVIAWLFSYMFEE